MDNIFTNTDILNKKGTIINYRLWVDGVSKNEIINKLEEKYNVKINSKNVKLADNVYYEEEEEFIWPSPDNSYYSEEGSCLALRDHLGILVDGTIVPCCLDSEGIINLGSIYKNEINDIINSNLFKEIKNGFLNNKKIHDLCKKCNFYELRRNHGSKRL